MTHLNEIIVGGWILFWLYWVISAVGAKKNARFDVRRFAATRIGGFILAILLVRVLTVNGYVLGSAYLVHESGVVMSIGFVLFLSGLALAVWARVHLGKNWGMPMTLKQEPELVTSGPYRYIRHPIYSGILLGVLGSAVTLGSSYWLIILVVCAVYFVFSAYAEEKIMLRQFPNAYPPYQKTTKMLVPFII